MSRRQVQSLRTEPVAAIAASVAPTEPLSPERAANGRRVGHDRGLRQEAALRFATHKGRTLGRRRLGALEQPSNRSGSRREVGKQCRGHSAAGLAALVLGYGLSSRGKGDPLEDLYHLVERTQLRFVVEFCVVEKALEQVLGQLENESKALVWVELAAFDD